MAGSMRTTDTEKNLPRMERVPTECLCVLHGFAHLGCGHKLHGFGDLASRFDRLHLAPDIAEASCHNDVLFLLGNGLLIVGFFFVHLDLSRGLRHETGSYLLRYDETLQLIFRFCSEFGVENLEEIEVLV